MKLSLFYALLIFAANGKAQFVNSFNYDTESGLPSSEVYTVRQVWDGKLWFTSDRGVFSYNGYEFKTYTTHDGLVNTTCFDIFEKDDSSLWFNGYDGSLSVYKNGKIREHSEITKFIKSHYAGDWIKLIEFYQGDIYFALTKNPILFKFSGAQKKIDIIPWSHSNRARTLKIGNAWYMLQLPERYIFGLEAYVSRLQHLHGNYYTGVVGKKVYFLENKDGAFEKKDSVELPVPIHSKMLCIGAAGDIFVCSGSKLITINFYAHTVSEKNLTGRFSPTSICIDRESNLWITTLNKGVFRIPSVSISKEFENIISGDKISSLGFAGDYLFAGSNTGIVYVFGPTGQAQIITLEEGEVPIDQIYTENGSLVYAYGSFRMLNGKAVKIKDPSMHSIQKITRISDNQFIYFWQRRLFLVKGNKTKEIQLSGAVPSLKAMEWQGGKLWLGTISGLVSFDLGKDTLENYTQYGVKNEVLSNRVNDLRKFRNGLLLAVFGKGLAYMEDGKVQMIKHLTLQPQILINKITIIDNENILLLTNKGLLYVKFASSSTMLVKSIQAIDVNHGLNSNFVNDAVLHNGSVWIATNKGINRIQMGGLFVEQPAPIVNITGLTTRDSVFRYQALLSIPAGQNTFVVEYEGISFRKPDQFSFYRYAFFASGEDTFWNYTNDRSIQLSNISPGTYSFIVSARNKNGLWSTPKILRILVMPRFYETRLFQFLVLVFILGSVLILFRYRLRKIKEKEHQLRKVELYGLKAKEAELMALRNQMNPHFLYNSLNSIQRYMVTNDFEAANAYMAKFSELVRVSLQMSKLEYISLEKEIKFLTNYVELEKLRFVDLFEFTITVDSELDDSDVWIPTLLIQPLLENSIKHGFKHIEHGGLIQLIVRPFEQQHLEILVIDNGCGMQPLSQPMEKIEPENSFGLSIVKERIKLLSQKLSDPKISFQIANIAEGVSIRMIVPAISIDEVYNY